MANTGFVCPVSVWRQRPLATSHSFTVRSKLPLASVRPSGAKANPVTQLACPASTCTLASDCSPGRSHIHIHPSWLPLASRRPSGLQANACTGLFWLGSIRRRVPEVVFQSRMVPSPPPLASVRPSGAKAMRWVLLGSQFVHMQHYNGYRYSQAKRRKKGKSSFSRNVKLLTLNGRYLLANPRLKSCSLFTLFTTCRLTVPVEDMQRGHTLLPLSPPRKEIYHKRVSSAAQKERRAKMGTLVYIGEFRLGWKVPASKKNCVAKSERFLQKSLAQHPISTFPSAARNSTVTKGDRYSSLAYKDTHTHRKG